MKKLCIFASEVSALIGKNPFVSKQECLDKIYQRYHNYRGGVSPSSTAGFSWEPPSVPPSPTRHTQTRCNVRKELNTLRADIEQNESKLRQAQMELKRSHNKPKHYKAYRNKRIKQLRKRIKDLRTDWNEMKSLDNCLAGQENEAKEVQIDNTPNSQKRFSKDLGDFIMIYGRVDGYDPEKKQVIEYKYRTKQRAGRIWESEYVQLQVYMWLTDSPTSQFVETFGCHRFEKQVAWDAVYWENVYQELVNVLESAFIMVSPGMLKWRPKAPIRQAPPSPEPRQPLPPLEPSKVPSPPKPRQVPSPPESPKPRQAPSPPKPPEPPEPRQAPSPPKPRQAPSPPESPEPRQDPPTAEQKKPKKRTFQDSKSASKPNKRYRKDPSDGFIYMVESDTHTHIGWTNDMGQRMETLESWNPQPLRLIFMCPGKQDQLPQISNEEVKTGWYTKGQTETKVYEIMRSLINA